MKNIFFKSLVVQKKQISADETEGVPFDQMKFFEKQVAESRNKTGTSKVGAISKAQKAQFSKYAQDVFMKSFENTFETPKVCLSCSI